MKIGIIDYGMGNIQSVQNSILHIGYSSDLVSQPDQLSDYTLLILPGVGAFPEAMSRLISTKLDLAILNHVSQGKPLLGICLGMQLLFSYSLEFDKTKGLDLISGSVLPFKDEISEKIPHMGWNNVTSLDARFKDFEGDYYFVHSFYCRPEKQEDVLFETNYEIDFCSAVSRNNQVYGVQFHPEKSQHLGLRLIKKIIEGC